MNEPTNTSRRGIMKTGLGLIAGAAAVAGAAGTARAQDQKIAKNLVQYQEQPKDGAECDKCVNWVAPNGCKIVEGTINPKGWCVAYAPKEG
jgi:membrane protease subunit (stomatin/prohibitin family)